MGNGQLNPALTVPKLGMSLFPVALKGDINPLLNLWISAKVFWVFFFATALSNAVIVACNASLSLTSIPQLTTESFPAGTLATLTKGKVCSTVQLFAKLVLAALASTWFC